jgi:hypothetical protein
MNNRILVKLASAHALAAADPRTNLRPLYTPSIGGTAALGFTGGPRWYVADLPAEADRPWDAAHAHVAAQLGVAESDVLFAEPDLVHRIFPDESAEDVGARLGAVGTDCTPKPQDGGEGRAVGPGEAWHLGDDFTQLARARSSVAFADRRTRIGQLDTGYFGAHVTLPRFVRRDLERNFVERDGDPVSAEDPDNKRLVLDNSGHGTGTLSILAGGPAPGLSNEPIGGAPEADVVPLRIADTVVLLHTSAFARALQYAVDIQCDVLSMSMGGLPSQAWKEAVDRAYLDGVFMVTAAGNNFGGLPTRKIVYPARYGRVVAACGVMADGRPYAHLQNRTMEGNYGPKKVMAHALGAYTPNIPWAMFGCPDAVRRDGGGTSSATPQVAAAAALWFEKHKAVLPRDWRRVEAVRHALFSTARKVHPEKLGQGTLRAADALGVPPALNLPQTKPDNDSFAFFRVITGLGITEPTPRERMFNLELAQRWLLNPVLQEIVPDPDDARLDEPQLARFMDAVIEDREASRALRAHVAERYVVAAGRSPARTERTEDVIAPTLAACDAVPPVPTPPFRRLRVYAMDPSASTRLETAGINDVTLDVRWEELEPGPVGEYLAVQDADASGETYPGVDLDDPKLLAQDGWAQSEGNAQFHQQMVYAVAMKVIDHFERAQGRPVLWRHRHNPADAYDDSGFVRQLTIRPHALRQANAYYSPRDLSLAFGYFEAAADDPGDHVPGSRVFTCLSQDIVAHETTHAILDGMHYRFNEATNPDVIAFHEAFADIVALLHHFTIPEVLAREVARTRGDIEAETMLGSLAVQLGKASGRGGALREAIGRFDRGVWRRLQPDPQELSRRHAPHERGAILVAAVFDAFLAVYKARVADLVRISTRGTGVLPSGAIHPDLVQRLAAEAAATAAHVLDMCIRALDYVPPVDITFFEFLRALITADSDLNVEDRLGYRVAFVESFRRRGIYPVNLSAATPDTLRTLSVDTLRWKGLGRFSDDVRKEYGAVIRRLKRYADQTLYVDDREALFDATRQERIALHAALKQAFAAVPDFAKELGLDPGSGFEVHALRPAMRVSPRGRRVPQVVVALTQAKSLRDPAAGPMGVMFRGGSTLVIDLSVPEVKYRIVKHITSTDREARTVTHLRELGADPLRSLMLALNQREPFAALHFLARESTASPQPGRGGETSPVGARP